MSNVKVLGFFNHIVATTIGGTMATKSCNNKDCNEIATEI